jgi:transcriptional regulator with XRE-family HTH domain
MNDKKEEEFLIEFGKSLNKIRKGKGLSMRQLAAMCKIDHSDIGKIEKGKINITILTLYELANTLECSTKDLLPENLTKF